MNREKAIRLAYFEALNNVLIYDSATVPVSDGRLNDDENDRYVILDEQSARIIEKFTQKSWECYQTLSIYSIESDNVSRDVVDDISEQIEGILYPLFEAGMETNGWQLNNFSVYSVEHRTFELTHSKSQLLKEMILKIEATKIASY